MLALTLLGPPTLRRGDAVVALPIRKSMALLLLLARHAAPLPRARIAALLWPDLDEATGRRNLRRELARLKDAGAGDALAVSGDVVGLAAAVAVDATAFEAAVDGGRVEDALALWHGAPADGFALGDADAFDDWLQRERERLLARRREALRIAASAREAAGDGPGALAHVESLLADDPLQEQHQRDAMRLLAALGRREAALAQHARCTALLQSELGLEPMAETDGLAAAIRGDRSGASASAPRTASPSSSGSGRIAPGDAGPTGPPTGDASTKPVLPVELPFVGRDAEIAAMEAAWAAGRAIVVEGDGGVGKSRLATDFVAAHGAFAIARCRPGDAELPYAAFGRALRVLMGTTPNLAGVAAWMTAEVARIVPELGAPPPPMRSDDERTRFFEACAQAWRHLADGDFDAVVLDDWHHADAASRALLAFVARRRREAATPNSAREIVVLRPWLDAEARASLDAFVGASDALHQMLRPLPGDAVLALVRRLAGGGEPVRFAQRLQSATAGNAFFIAETLRHLVDTGWLTTDTSGGWQTPFDASTEDYRELPVPASVHEAVLGRSRRLPLPSQRILEAASLADEPFAPALLAPACALSELEALLAIEAAIDDGLLVEHDASGYAFAHDLAQQALSGSLSDERRRLVHRRLALGAESAGAPAATIAAHHEAGGDTARAVVHRLAAGDEARRLRALADALAHWRRGLADRPTPADEVRLRDRIVAVARSRDDTAALLAESEALGALLARADLSAPDRVAASVARGMALACGGRAADALAVLDDLPEPSALPSGASRIAALHARALAAEDLGRIAEAAEAVHRALAEPALSVAARLDLLDLAFLLEFNAGHNEAALVHADACLALARQTNDGAGMARGEFRRGILLLRRHDTAAAAASLQQAADDSERLGLVRLQRAALYNLTVVHGGAGRHAEALAAARHGWQLEPPLEAGDLRIAYRLALVDAWFGLGALGECWPEAEAAAHETLARDDPHLVMGAVTCLLDPFGVLGETALARQLLAKLDGYDTRALKASADEVWVVLAQFELRQDNTEAASLALARLNASGEATEPRVRMRHALANAELALASGDIAKAIAAMPADDANGMNGEMRLRSLALRIRAEATSGLVTAATVAAALAALAEPAAHAIAALELHTALARAVADGVTDAPSSILAAQSARLRPFTESLDAHPARRQAFVAAFAVPSRSSHT